MDIFNLTNWFWPEWTIFGIASYIIAGLFRMYTIFKYGFRLKDYFEEKGWPTWPIKYTLGWFGFVYDVWLNYWVSLLFWDKPRAWDETITHRMKRYKKNEPDSWRGKFAFWMCAKLNKHDNGHC